MTDQTASDYPDFESVLESLVTVLDRLPERAQEFIDGMQERFEEYGDDCFVTDKQWAWMQKLAEEFT